MYQIIIKKKAKKLIVYIVDAGSRGDIYKRYQINPMPEDSDYPAPARTDDG